MAQGRPALVESPDGDLIISQGSDNTYGFVWSRNGTPVPLVGDGWVLEAQLRKRVGGEVWLTLSSEPPGSGIEIDDLGHIYVAVDWRETEAVAWNHASRQTGVWDLEAYNPGTDEKKRLVMGVVQVSPDVTRSGDSG